MRVVYEQEGNTASEKGPTLPLGEHYATPSSNSANETFPTQNAFQGKLKGGFTVFVSKLNASGNAFIYSTYLGGSVGEIGYGIAVDSAGNMYLTGYTQSRRFPTVNALQKNFGGGSYDAFVTKIGP